jgi:F-type H+-transporting ATPase subunit alpha
VRESGKFEDESAAAVTEALDKFKPTFQTSDGQLLAGKEETAAMDSEDVEQEQIRKQKRG